MYSADSRRSSLLDEVFVIPGAIDAGSKITIEYPGEGAASAHAEPPTAMGELHHARLW